MKFKEYVLLEELNHNGTATVYHRTRDINNLPFILKQGFLNQGLGYGDEFALYATFSLEDQFDPRMIFNYGPIIVKLHVTELDKYIVYHPDIAKKIHGKDYKLSDQFRKFNLSQEFTQDQLDSIDQEQEFTREGKTGKFLSAVPAKRLLDPKDLLTIFYKANKDGNLIRNKIKGAIFLDPHGFANGDKNILTLLKYKPVNDGTIKILGYAEANYDNASPERMNQLYYDKNAWKTSTDIASFKSIQKIPYDYKNDGEKREKYLQINKKSIIDIIKEFKTTRDISSYELKMLLDSNKDKDKIAKIIIKHKKELTNTNVRDLLESAVNKDEIAKLIIKYKKELTNDDVCNLLIHAYNKYEIANILQEDINKLKLKENDVNYLLDRTSYDKKDEIAKVIIHYKKELTNDDVFNLLHHSNSKDEIAEFLGQKNINKLLPFLHSANDKFSTSIDQTINEILTFIIKYKKELTNDDIEYLLYMSPNTSKSRDLMIKYHPDKIPEIKNALNNY
jgi:hypothetical protein